MNPNMYQDESIQFQLKKVLLPETYTQKYYVQRTVATRNGKLRNPLNMSLRIKKEIYSSMWQV